MARCSGCACFGTRDRRGPVSSGRAVTRHLGPRRVASNREEYRDGCRAPVVLNARPGRPASGQWESAHNNSREPRCSRRCEAFTTPRGQSLHASAVKDLLCPPCEAARARSPRAFSSVGESARLITVRSLVRIQKGPRPRSTDRSVCSWGCSSAGRAPALQAGGRRFEPGHLHGGASLVDHSRPSGRYRTFKRE